MRRAAAGNRLRAGHALGGGSDRLPDQAAPDAAIPRRFGLQDAGGLSARGCEPLRPPGRPEGIRYAHRDEEHQQLQGDCARDCGRIPPAGGVDRGRRAGEAADPPLGRQQGCVLCDALQGERAGLPLLPRAGSAADGDFAGVYRRGARAPAGAGGGEDRPLSAGIRPAGIRRADSDGGKADGRAVRAGGGGLRPGEGGFQLDHGRDDGHDEGKSRSARKPDAFRRRAGRDHPRGGGRAHQPPERAGGIRLCV